MKKKVLLIGGTGTISSAVTRLLSECEEWEVTLLNRGSKHDIPSHVKTIRGDIRSAEAGSLLAGKTWDVVVDFIAFTPEHIEKTSNSLQIARISISLSVRLRPIVNRFRVRLSPSLHR